MDDSEYVLKIQHSIAERGFWLGLIHNINAHRIVDLSFAGVLRPSFWVHASTIYLLPVEWALRKVVNNIYRTH